MGDGRLPSLGRCPWPWPWPLRVSTGGQIDVPTLAWPRGSTIRRGRALIARACAAEISAPECRALALGRCQNEVRRCQLGCDETADGMVADALKANAGLSWIDSSTQGSEPAGQAGRNGTRNTTRQGLSALPGVRAGIANAIDAQVSAWRADNNTTAMGNLGEQVAVRVLERMGYQVLATQADLQGGVPTIVGSPTRMNPEDLLVVTPDGRYSTVNVKTSTTEKTSSIRRDGNLKAPAMSEGQAKTEYHTKRADLLSPIDGDAFGMVLKVDLVHKQAQVLEINDGRQRHSGEPMNVLEDLAAVVSQFPAGDVPPPSGPNAS